MYLEHFGLRDKPFRIPPSPRMLYPSETHDEGRARILYGIRENRGFVVVTGAVGLGKTTVLLSVLEELEETVSSALIFNPVESFDQLLRMICLEFGIGVANDADEVTCLHALNRWLVERYAEGISSVLLIDEAQNLSLGVLERLRMLSNLQTEDASLLQIVLVGQPELYTKMMDHRLLQLRQRVGVWHEIEPLGREDTIDYLAHRLRMSGSPRPREIFSKECSEFVHALSGGVPRLINQICDTALVIAFGRGARSVTVGHVREAATELRLAERQSSPTTKTVDPPAVEAREAPVERSPTRTPRIRARRGVALAAALLIVAIGIFEGMRRDVFPRWLERWTTSSAESAEPSAMASDLPDLVSETARDALPGPVELDPGAVDRVRSGQRTTQAWQAEGRPVYSVHLGSFESRERAEDFAQRLLDARWRWQQGVYIDSTGGWQRVLAGGFLSPSEARGWIREIQAELHIEYAQIVRLDRSAVCVVVELVADAGGMRG